MNFCGIVLLMALSCFVWIERNQKKLRTLVGRSREGGFFCGIKLNFGNFIGLRFQVNLEGYQFSTSIQIGRSLFFD